MTKQERTQRLIEKFKGIPGEYDALKGVLLSGCLTNVRASDTEFFKWRAEEKLVESVFDSGLIARRMDELNKGI